jgi:hypothetical protein
VTVYARVDVVKAVLWSAFVKQDATDARIQLESLVGILVNRRCAIGEIAGARAGLKPLLAHAENAQFKHNPQSWTWAGGLFYYGTSSCIDYVVGPVQDVSIHDAELA